ncbi:MAG TPA: SH3 domain-containing protein [Candidatus Nanopelagicaceae bacterium]|nr:SH3 domain-containing protein [Candidatus Nanopelagicaceae bacterium]
MWRRVGALRGPGLALIATVVLVGCGASPPASTPSPRTSPKPSSTPSPAATAVTVLAPDGVNFRTQPSPTAAVVGIVAQGITLPIISHTSAAGGWWQVKGSTATGWITSNPEYTSTGTFQTFTGGSSTLPWSVLYAGGWNFAQDSSGAVVFTGPDGDSIIVTQAGSTAQLPAAAPSGTPKSDVAAVDIYGITTSLVTFSVSSGYLAAVAFQAEPGLAFLIEAKAPTGAAAAAFGVFLSTFKFPLPAASPTP